MLCPVPGLCPRGTARPRRGRSSSERSPWPVSREQARLKAGVVEEDTEEWQRDPSFAGLERVGGVDLSYIKGDDTSACASLVVLSYPALEVMAAGRLHPPGLRLGRRNTRVCRKRTQRPFSAAPLPPA